MLIFGRVWKQQGFEYELLLYFLSYQDSPPRRSKQCWPGCVNCSSYIRSADLALELPYFGKLCMQRNMYIPKVRTNQCGMKKCGASKLQTKHMREEERSKEKRRGGSERIQQLQGSFWPPAVADCLLRSTPVLAPGAARPAPPAREDGGAVNGSFLAAKRQPVSALHARYEY